MKITVKNTSSDKIEFSATRHTKIHQRTAERCYNARPLVELTKWLMENSKKTSS